MSRGLGRVQLRLLHEAATAWKGAYVDEDLSMCWVKPWRLRRWSQSVEEYRSEVGAERRAIRRLVALDWLVTEQREGYVGYGEFRPPLGEPDATEDWEQALSLRKRPDFAISPSQRLPAESAVWPRLATQRFADFLRDVPYRSDDPATKPALARSAAPWSNGAAAPSRAPHQFGQARQRAQTHAQTTNRRIQRLEAIRSFELDFESRLLWTWQRAVPNLPWRHAWARWCASELQLHD